MSVTVTIVRKRRDRDYFQQQSLPAYSYQSSYEAAVLHIERNRLTDLSSNTVTVVFKKEFDSIPVTLLEPKAYKMAEIVPGKYQRKDIQSYYATANPLSTTGFELVIEGSLTGVIVEYAFIER